MAIANYFYNQTTRKYVALFGTLFNQLKIERVTTDGSETQSMIVPLSYAPFQKILSRVQQDPDLLNSTKPAISLPRMSFEITTMFYDPSRKVSSTRKVLKNNPGPESNSFMYSPVPYNIEFSLYIMTKYSEDAVKILEQIVPFFTPDYTVSARMVPNMDPLDIPVVLNSITTEELYEGSYEERQTVLYTLSFTLRGWFFGPERESKTIKFIEAGFAADTTSNAFEEEFARIRPGLDSEGNPVTMDGIQAVAAASIAGGALTSIDVIQNGYGYTSNTSVTIAPSDSASANATPIISNTSISSFNINDGGGYYTSTPSISISAPDKPVITATGSAVILNDGVDSINITNNGTFYDSATVTIEEPPAKSSIFKFGDDALEHTSPTDSTEVITMPTNLVTFGQGHAIEFWIYPTQSPASDVNVIEIGPISVRLQPNLFLAYRQSPASTPIDTAPHQLQLNAWNHVRLEDAQGTGRWLINGTVDDGFFTAVTSIQTAGEPVIVGDVGVGGFVGVIDNLSMDQITSATPVGIYTIPTAPTTGSIFTVNFDKDPATATATVVDGEVTEVTVTNSGSNYGGTTPVITFSSPNGTASNWQASATAVIANGEVTDVVVNDAGKFYVNPTITIDSPVTTDATAEAVVADSGDIVSINITNPGSGYRTIPTVTISSPEIVSIPYQQIEFGDDWGVITVIEDV